MEGEQILGGGAGKADNVKRFVAVFVDSLIAGLILFVVSLIVGVINYRLGQALGGLVGGAYFLLRDGLNLEALGGQSVGKKLMALKVVGTTQPIDFVTSIKRNITIGFVWPLYILLLIPVLGALVVGIAGLAQLVVAIIEIYKVLTDPQGKRIGDSIAETMVIQQ